MMPVLRSRSIASSPPMAIAGFHSPDSPTPASVQERSVFEKLGNTRHTREAKVSIVNGHTHLPDTVDRSIPTDHVLNDAIGRMKLGDDRAVPDTDITLTHNDARAPSDTGVTLVKPEAENEQATDEVEDEKCTNSESLSKRHTLVVGDQQDDSEVEPRGLPQACLFVASLCSMRTEAELTESVTRHFNKWGPLLHVKVLRDWLQRPYSFVQFENVEQAQRAMAEAQNSVVDGRHIRIEPARVNRTLCLLRISRSTTEGEISEVMEEYGPLEDVSIFFEPGPPRSRRSAFVRYAYREDAIRAYMCLRGNSKWAIEWAPNLSNQNHNDHVDKDCIFIGQLDPEMATEEALRERFSAYGEILNINLIRKNKYGEGNMSAFAFVEYDNEQSASNAIANEHCSSFMGSTIRVQYRETAEHRHHRHQNAQTAAQPLSQRFLGVGVTQAGFYDSSGLFTPHRVQGIGRHINYQIPCVPYLGANMAIPAYMSAAPVAGSAAPYRSHAAQRSPSGPDMTHGFCHGVGPYSVSTIGRPDTRQARPDHTLGSFEYPAYVPTPEGYFYPQPTNYTVQGATYPFDQGQVNNMQPVGNLPSPQWHSCSMRFQVPGKRRGFESSKENGIPALSPHNVESSDAVPHVDTASSASAGPQNAQQSSSDATWRPC
ncbi:hypothetical protein BG004_003426 [Podila humilis]|nr:hypothetical protein BG004_003426 [Podila humilis]